MEGAKPRQAGQPREQSSKWPYIVGLGIILGSEYLVRDILLPMPARDADIGIAMAVEWLVLLALLAYWLPRVEGKGLASIGLSRFRWRYLWLGAVVYLLATLAMMGSGLVVQSMGLPTIRSLQPMIKGYSTLTLVGLFFTGTFVEEVFYRGYLVERVTSLVGRRWVAALFSWLAFTGVHLRFFGLGPTLDVSVLSAALVLLYLRERSIWPCVVVHGLNGLFAYLVFPLLMP
jgi:membrane protease YdiL (CAAX protease family)